MKRFVLLAVLAVLAVPSFAAADESAPPAEPAASEFVVFDFSTFDADMESVSKSIEELKNLHLSLLADQLAYAEQALAERQSFAALMADLDRLQAESDQLLAELDDLIAELCADDPAECDEPGDEADDAEAFAAAASVKQVRRHVVRSKHRAKVKHRRGAHRRHVSHR